MQKNRKQMVKTVPIKRDNFGSDIRMEGFLYDLLEDNEIQKDPAYTEFTSKMVCLVLELAQNLTKMVIDNKIRNSEKFLDEEIYGTFKRSLEHVRNSVEDIE